MCRRRFNVKHSIHMGRFYSDPCELKFYRYWKKGIIWKKGITIYLYYARGCVAKQFAALTE